MNSFVGVTRSAQIRLGSCVHYADHLSSMGRPTRLRGGVVLGVRDTLSRHHQRVEILAGLRDGVTAATLKYAPEAAKVAGTVSREPVVGVVVCPFEEALSRKLLKLKSYIFLSYLPL